MAALNANPSLIKKKKKNGFRLKGFLGNNPHFDGWGDSRREWSGAASVKHQGDRGRGKSSGRRRRKKKRLHSREGMDLGSRGGLVDNNILAASEAL